MKGSDPRALRWRSATTYRAQNGGPALIRAERGKQMPPRIEPERGRHKSSVDARELDPVGRIRIAEPKTAYLREAEIGVDVPPVQARHIPVPGEVAAHYSRSTFSVRALLDRRAIAVLVLEYRELDSASPRTAALPKRPLEHRPAEVRA